MRKTIFIDIDGTIVEHPKNIEDIGTEKQKVLNGVVQKFREWNKKEYKIIICTARKESYRKITEEQLGRIGIGYDMVIFGCGRGARVTINDLKPNNDMFMAESINLERDKGLAEIDI